MLNIRIESSASLLALILIVLIPLDVVHSFVFKGDYHTVILVLALFGVMLFYFALKASRSTLLINYKYIISMALLCLWITFRSLLDAGDMEYASNFLFKTNSGIIFFFVMGVIFNTLNRDEIIFNNDSFGKFQLFISLLLFISVVFLFGYWILSLMDNVVAWAFIVSLDIREGYQWVSDFVSILFVVISLLAGHIWLCRHVLFFYRVVLLALYMVATLEFLLFFILVGANKQFVLVISVFLLNIVLLKFVKTGKGVIHQGKFYRNLELLASAAFYKFIIKRVFLPLVAVFLVAAAAIVLYEADLPNIRLLNAGSEGLYGSFLNRIELIQKNYLEHLSHSPFFGNVLVDKITTGDGTYAHSFLLYASTHLGFFGFFVLLAVIVTSISARIHVKYRGSSSTDDLYRVYFNVFLFLIVFLIANVATFTYWSVFWFVLGSSFPCIRFVDHLNLFPQSQLGWRKPAKTGRM